MPIRLLGLALLAALSSLAAAQAPKYWPQHEIGFPVPQSVLDMTPRPVKLRLFVAGPDGRFERASELPADRLQPIPNRRSGFQYTARGDGEEVFAVQLVYADGTVSPSENQLRPEFRVIFDTRPPSINLQSLGTSGVQWQVTDENLDLSGIRLECRWASTDGRWHEVKSREFAPRDEYSWSNLGRERTLEVRLRARDKAGHEAVSRIIRLPDPVGGSRRDLDALPLNAVGGSSRDLDLFPSESANIVFVNRRDLTVRSKLTHITRSGVSKLHLYVKDYAAGPGGDWKFDKTQPCDIRYEASETTVEIPFVAPKDGRYGFIVIPESGVGRREPEPRSGTPPQHLVEVDTVKPVVKVRSVTVSPGGAIGPRVEIEWDADDRNLMPDPIVIEYAADKDAVTWHSIAEKIPNSRRYVWEVADKSLFKLYVRVRATDKATNVGEHVFDQAVIVDLDKPAATIDTIRGSGSAAPLLGDKPSLVAPQASTPVELPSVTPPKPAGGVKVPDLLPPPN